ncbi:MAG: polysaccharide biosynthesis tyrosine autokinase [Planctomycetaceae bacterium]|nr:polysaccharide biosynthesis tyrosine autokinase [Planctomycetaceae bacterium]
MDELENKIRPPLQGELIDYSEPMEGREVSMAEVLGAVLRRWYVVFGVFVLVTGVALAGIYYFMGKKYDTEGAIQVSTIVPRIIYQVEDTPPPYMNFKNTQAAIIGRDIVLNRAADELKDKNLIFFDPLQNYVPQLRKMLVNEDIKIFPDRENEYIFLRMTTDYPKQAEQVVDALIRGYMSVTVSEESRGEDERLSVLEKRRRMLEDEMEQHRLKIRQRVEEYGTGELTTRQQIMLEQVGTLQKELVAASIRRLMLETQVNTKESQVKTQLSQETVNLQKSQLIEADPLVRSLQGDVQRYEEMVREGRTTMQESNPELKRRMDVLEDLKRQTDKRRNEVVIQVEEQIRQQTSQSRQGELENARAELAQTVVYETRIREKLEELDAETIGLGRKQFEIDDYREQLEQTKAIYSDLTRRIEEINIERSRQPRIAVGSYARSVEAKGKRRKLTAAAAFGGIALGIALALMVDKVDKRVKAPSEVTKQIGMRIIGTTTSLHDINKKLLPQQLFDDYQTIRANIGLLEDAQNTKIITVTSPGMGDGKTTFSVNLATSFAHSGKKTLLIDGDLRKPDIGMVLNLPAGLRGLQDYLFGYPIDRAVYKIDGIGLYVLAADNRNSVDALEMLSNPESMERIRALVKFFDKIIIDTPPVLAFADTLLWSKISDGTLLTSFVGHTTRPEMQEAIERLTEIRAKILGTVVNNVKMTHSYRRYGYGYGYSYDKSIHKKHRLQMANRSSMLLISSVKSEEKQSNA